MSISPDSYKDDLTRIEGIGAKIEELLHQAGIYTYLQLSWADTDNIKAMLDKAGSSYQMHDPGSWAQQAELAADGDWEALKKWQDGLHGGK